MPIKSGVLVVEIEDKLPSAVCCPVDDIDALPTIYDPECQDEEKADGKDTLQKISP